MVVQQILGRGARFFGVVFALLAVLAINSSSLRAQEDGLFDLFSEPAQPKNAPAAIEPLSPNEEISSSEEIAVPAADRPAANEDGAELPTLTLRQWMPLGAGGRLVGEVMMLDSEAKAVACEGVRVFLVRDGEVEASVRSMAGGRFEFTGVRPGVTTIIANDQQCFAAYSLTLVDGTGLAKPELLTVFAISPWEPSRRAAILSSSTSATATPTTDTAVQFVSQQRDMRSTVRVAIDADGGFTGTVLYPGRAAGASDMTGMMVRVLRGGQLVREAAVKQDGSFAVTGVGAGPVGVVVFGPKGFAATAIELVAPSARSAATSTLATESLVMLQGAVASGVNVEIAPNGDVAPVVNGQTGEEGEEEGSVPLDIPPPEFAGFGGGAPAGGFGGGGGGGGMGGIGELAGLAAIGAALAAFAGDDDNNFVPRVVSPAVP